MKIVNNTTTSIGYEVKYGSTVVVASTTLQPNHQANYVFDKKPPATGNQNIYTLTKVGDAHGGGNEVIEIPEGTTVVFSTTIQQRLFS